MTAQELVVVPVPLVAVDVACPRCGQSPDVHEDGVVPGRIWLPGGLVECRARRAPGLQGWVERVRGVVRG